jgi:hypothetical protein
LSGQERLAANAPLTCLPHHAPKRKPALPSFDCAIA